MVRDESMVPSGEGDRFGSGVLTIARRPSRAVDGLRTRRFARRGGCARGSNRFAAGEVGGDRSPSTVAGRRTALRGGGRAGWLMQTIGQGAVVICSIARCGRGRSGIATAAGSVIGLPLAARGWSTSGSARRWMNRRARCRLSERSALGGYAFGFLASEVLVSDGVAPRAGDRDDV